MDYQNKQDDTDEFDVEDRYERITAVTVECLALLQKVPDAIEVRYLELSASGRRTGNSDV